MRLIDMVMQAPAIVGDPGPVLSGAREGAGSLASSIASTNLRYILDRPASDQCAALVFLRGGPLARPDDLTRLPSRPFWLECFADGGSRPGDSDSHLQRMGFLVAPSPDGLSGVIDCIFQTHSGDVHRLPARIDFDVGGGNLSTGRGRHRMRHPREPEIDRLLEGARLAVDEGWHDLARSASAPYTQSVAGLAEVAWCALPLVLCFAALLNARNALVHRPSSLERLNVARARSGKPMLLHHVEVGLNLTPAEDSRTRAMGTIGERHSPCLHFVRGHNVTRAGRTFWRTSHFRGDGVAEPTRTVLVTASRRVSGSTVSRSGSSAGQNIGA